MDIDKDKLKRIMLWFVQNMQNLETELLAYKTLCFYLKPEIPNLDESLQIARESPDIKETIAQRYRPIREKLDQLIDAIQLDQDLDEFLRQWKPTGPPN